MTLDPLPNALERVNAETDRRANVVGIFPDTAALLRPFTALLQEQHDEWAEARRYLAVESLTARHSAPLDDDETILVLAEPDWCSRMSR
ncbi:MAG: transposase [Candidatus Dormibacteria bacterium]